MTRKLTPSRYTRNRADDLILKDTLDPRYTRLHVRHAREHYQRFIQRVVGSKGEVQMDRRWFHFPTFVEDMGIRPGMRILMRMDASKPYQKDNCYWGSRDQISTGRKTNKLTEAQAVEIALKMMNGAVGSKIAEEYGVSRTLPGQIVRGTAWRTALAKAKAIIAEADDLI